MGVAMKARWFWRQAPSPELLHSLLGRIQGAVGFTTAVMSGLLFIGAGCVLWPRNLLGLATMEWERSEARESRVH